MKALILSGGISEYMSPFNKTRPNTNLQIAGKSCISRTVEFIKAAGIKSISIVVADDNRELIENECKLISDVQMNFITQKKKGIGASILSASDQFSPSERFLLLYGDIFSSENIFANIIQTHGVNKGHTALICHTEDSANYGNVYLDEKARITKLIEKPGKKVDLHNYVLAGLFVFSTKLFEHLRATGSNMVKAMNRMVRSEVLQATIWDHDWIDLRFPWDILEANRCVMRHWTTTTIHSSVLILNAEISGPVHIEQGAKICSGAVLQGPLYIGQDAFIGHNALIRPYSSIGDRTIIGQGVEMKNSIIFNDSEIGRNSFIGDSVIGSRVRMGAGCMTLNNNADESSVSVKIKNKKFVPKLEKVGAFIGDNSIIGASNSIRAGSVIHSGYQVDHNISIKS
ncbi:MAG: sugar phosphate nucleotidyltransferase [Nitrospinota bacterium]